MKIECEHRHSPNTHPNCFKFLQEKHIGALDIETFCWRMKADMGIVLSYCIYDFANDEFLGRIITPEELVSKTLDKQIVSECITDLRKFDWIVTHYGNPGRFDTPFLRTRALMHGLIFPGYKELYVDDTYTIAKNRLSLSSNRQGNISKVLRGKVTKIDYDFFLWLRAVQGNEKALKQIGQKNIDDVKMLAQNYTILQRFSSARRTSI